MKKTMMLLALTLSTLLGSTASAGFAVSARTSIPACAKAQIAIFNGRDFNGRLYLHDLDVDVDPRTIAVVRAIAAQGETPAICHVSGITFVTVAE
jgi:hypothetical protein